MAPKAAWNKTEILIDKYKNINNDHKIKKQRYQLKPQTSTEAPIVTTKKDKSTDGNYKQAHKQEITIIDK